jgi:hypothetical protein
MRRETWIGTRCYREKGNIKKPIWWVICLYRQKHEYRSTSKYNWSQLRFEETVKSRRMWEERAYSGGTTAGDMFFRYDLALSVSLHYSYLGQQGTVVAFPHSLKPCAMAMPMDCAMTTEQVGSSGKDFGTSSALGPTQPPIQWVPGTLSLGVKRPGVKLTAHLQLVPKSRKCGSIHPLLHTPSLRSA